MSLARRLLGESQSILLQLCDETGTHPDEWESVSGLETGVGEEYWFEHTSGDTAYVCDDQGSVTVTFPVDHQFLDDV